MSRGLGDVYKRQVIYCADTNKFNASRAVLKSTIAEGADVIARQTKRAREAVGFGGEVK